MKDLLTLFFCSSFAKFVFEYISLSFYFLKKEVLLMAYRENTKKSLDKKVFRNTASSTKLINVSPKQMRGGIRL